jgi:hypothetical protein
MLWMERVGGSGEEMVAYIAGAEAPRGAVPRATQGRKGWGWIGAGLVASGWYAAWARPRDLDGVWDFFYPAWDFCSVDYPHDAHPAGSGHRASRRGRHDLLLSAVAWCQSQSCPNVCMLPALPMHARICNSNNGRCTCSASTQPLTHRRTGVSTLPDNILADILRCNGGAGFDSSLSIGEPNTGATVLNSE